MYTSSIRIHWYRIFYVYKNKLNKYIIKTNKFLNIILRTFQLPLYLNKFTTKHPVKN